MVGNDAPQVEHLVLVPPFRNTEIQGESKRILLVVSMLERLLKRLVLVGGFLSMHWGLGCLGEGEKLLVLEWGSWCWS